MVLAMARPFRHPKTGMYWLRKVVPAPLRAVVGKRELVASLGTKDCAEAKAKAAPALERFERIIAAARNGGSLTDADLEGICQEWYRGALAEWWDNPGQPSQWVIYRDLLDDQIEKFDDPGIANDPDVVPRVFLKPGDRTEAAALLEARGHLADDAAIARLAERLFEAKWALCGALEKRAGSLEVDKAGDAAARRFPAVLTLKAPEVAPTTLLMEALVNAWAAENGTKGRALYDRQRTAKSLAHFLGNDDAAKVTADDVVRWKETRLAAGRSTKTVANDIGELRPIWTWARRNRKLAFDDNPFAGLSPRTKKRGGLRVRGPFTEEEARRLLEAARAEHAASLHWLPWACCFTGARIGELAQSRKEDIRREGDGPWCIYIHEQGDGRTLKTPHSERMVPLHPTLLAEGFLRHVQSLPAGSPIFPDLKPDSFGSMGGTATKKLGRWVRRKVGIIDRSKDPAHAWRHRFEDQARRAGVPQNVTDALLGHLNAMNESEGYGRGFRFMPDATAPYIEKMASPLAAVG